MRKLTRISALAAIMVCGLAFAEVKLPPVISSHMVLQQGVNCPVWGTAGAGEKVTVKFRDQEKSADADAQGKWMVKLDPLKVGEPATMTIAGSNTLTLEDVVVGEVWVGSGQSNMQMDMFPYVKNDPVLAKISNEGNPQLRLITSGRKGWEVSTPQSNQTFSALCFSFGVPLQKELNVPLGLMVGAVGGTPSGMWLTQEQFDADEACKNMVAKFAATYSFEDAQKKYKDDLEKWEKLAAQAKADGKKDPPGKPHPPTHAGECASQFGFLYKAHIQPYIPFAIKGVLWDQGESGTAVLGVEQYQIMGALIRGWRKEWGQGDFPFIHVQKPSGGGCAWDKEDPITNKADSFGPLPDEKILNSGPNNYREAHIKLSEYPNTAMVIATDLGGGIHPSNKSGYGARACRVALGMVYGKKIEYYGPVYASHKIEDGKVRVSYTHAGQGLAFKNGTKLQGFALAGDDKVFHWAEATIDGDTVVLSCEKVSKPAAVRYAWSMNAPWANLFNKDGLPAIAFRTDSW